MHDLSGQQMIGLTICDSSIRSLVDYASFERLSIGVVEYLSCHKCGFQEGSPADVRFRYNLVSSMQFLSSLFLKVYRKIAVAYCKDSGSIIELEQSPKVGCS